jgi:hypothetical protein
MCTFITVGVSPKRKDALIAALRAARLQCAVQTNPGMPACFPPGRALLLVTNGMCSCDLSVQPAPAEPPADRQTKRKKKSKLTPGQLARVLAAPPKTPTPHRSDAIRAAFIAVLEQFKPVEVFHHTVRKDPQTEPVPEGSRAEPFPIEATTGPQA